MRTQTARDQALQTRGEKPQDSGTRPALQVLPVSTWAEDLLGVEGRPVGCSLMDSGVLGLVTL